MILWYRQPMVWLILAIPATSVLLGSIMLTLATQGPTDLVRSDWYKHGRAVNEDLSRLHQAAALGLSAEVQIDGRQVLVKLAGAEDPDALVLDLIHPTRAADDLQLVLTRVGHGLWQSRLPMAQPAPAGLRRLHLSNRAGNWRLEGESHLPDSQIRLQGLGQ